MAGFDWWMATAAANAVIVAVFGMIAFVMVRSLWKGRQWRSNPILVAAAALVITFTLGHGVHLVHSLEPSVGASLGFSPGVGAATRVSFADPMLLVWDGFTALIAVAFWVFHRRLASQAPGQALCEDMEMRQRQALDLHDNVVQGLARARLALDTGRRAEAEQALGDTLREAKRITSGLLGDRQDMVPLGPRKLRRGRARLEAR